MTQIRKLNVLNTANADQGLANLLVYAKSGFGVGS